MYKHYLTHISCTDEATGLEIGTVSREVSRDCFLHPCNPKIGEQMIILPAKKKIKDEIAKFIGIHPLIEDDEEVYAIPIKILYPTMKIKVNGEFVNLASEENFDYSDLILKKE